MPKKFNQRLKLLRIKDILETYTDDGHGIMAIEIDQHLKAYNINVERKAIYDAIEDLKEYGLDIGHEKREKGYRLISRTFELSELKLLIDSILSSKFLSENKTRELIDKLKTLCSREQAKQLQREVLIANRVKTMNTSIIRNVDYLHDALFRNRQVRFRYFDYDIKKERVYRKKGAYYTVSPWRLIYTDDNYYLLGYDEEDKKFKHFRVDKMDKLSLIDDTERTGKEAFEQMNMANYTKYTFSMFGGEVQKVTMVFQNRMVGAVMDRFGRDIMMMKEDKDHFRVTVPVAVSQQFFGWVFGLGNYVRIVAPESVKAQMQKALADITERYSE